jgi:hypothetical protein
MHEPIRRKVRGRTMDEHFRTFTTTRRRIEGKREWGI